ncbi:MAG TPA: nucleotidyl transferase AbiEii/AbiGii toxin family protein [Longimicrobium sp.]|nr:nucleotidyl transferase AbiEii/AbiGii toxin family protein [Longimicrobium sp.]
MLKHDPAVIGELHLRVLHAVARANESAGIPDLRLDGGTALAAYYLHHRQSEDLDFFGGPALNARELGERVREEALRDGVSLEPAGPSSTGFARYVARDLENGSSEAVKVDIAGQSPFLLAPLEPTVEGIRIGSYRDLCANKLHALCDRFEARDFADLHAILHRPEPGAAVGPDLLRARFHALLEDLVTIDPGLDAKLLGEGLARGVGKPLVSLFPLRLLLPFTDSELQETVRFCMDECVRIVNEVG